MSCYRIVSYCEEACDKNVIRQKWFEKQHFLTYTLDDYVHVFLGTYVEISVVLWRFDNCVINQYVFIKHLFYRRIGTRRFKGREGCVVTTAKA
jgi:hypothetical protein